MGYPDSNARCVYCGLILPCGCDYGKRGGYIASCHSCAKPRWVRDGEWAEHEKIEEGFLCKSAATKVAPLTITTMPVSTDGTVGGCVSTNYRTKDEQARVGRTIGELDWRSEAALIEPGTLKRNDLLGWHRELCDEARDLMSAKNRDYASDADPLRNFKMSAQVAGISPEQCALIYLGENVAKFRSFIENGGKSYVAGEKFTDHVRDTINFVILLYAILIDRGYFKEKK